MREWKKRAEREKLSACPKCTRWRCGLDRQSRFSAQPGSDCKFSRIVFCKLSGAMGVGICSFHMSLFATAPKIEMHPDHHVVRKLILPMPVELTISVEAGKH